MVHGDEFDGLAIVRELLETLDPAEMRGEVWILGVANPLAMEAVTRNTPLDMLDMNRLFPGSPDGWLSEQQAHAISRAFLSELLYQPAVGYAGTTATYAEQRGVRCMVVEIGGGYQEQAAHIGNGVVGLTNQLRYAGVLAGEVVRRPGQRLMTEMKVMRPRHGGICIPRRKLAPGMELDGGEPLADIVSPYTFETLETLEAPFERSIVVLCRNYQTRIHPGDYGFMMGNGATTSALAD